MDGDGSPDLCSHELCRFSSKTRDRKATNSSSHIRYILSKSANLRAVCDIRVRFVSVRAVPQETRVGIGVGVDVGVGSTVSALSLPVCSMIEDTLGGQFQEIYFPT